MKASQLFGGASITKSITNGFSAGGVNSAIGVSSRSIASGALTSGVLANILTISSAGQCDFLGAYSLDGTSRTIRLQVIVDGTTVFDATTNAVLSTNNGLVAASPPVGSSPYGGAPIRFGSSLVVNIASSLTETGKTALGYTAQTF